MDSYEVWVERDSKTKEAYARLVQVDEGGMLVRTYYKAARGEDIDGLRSVEAALAGWSGARGKRSYLFEWSPADGRHHAQIRLAGKWHHVKLVEV